MLCSLFAAALLLAPVPGIAAAAEHRPRVTRGDGFIRSPVNALPDPAPKLSGRQNEIEVANQRSGTRYAVDVSIGTPPQEVTLILDTGSPDTWFNPSCETANVPRDCRAFSRFDYTKSSSFNSTRVWDILVYGIGNATIEYAFETLTIGCKSGRRATRRAARAARAAQPGREPSDRSDRALTRTGDRARSRDD